MTEFDAVIFLTDMNNTATDGLRVTGIHSGYLREIAQVVADQDTHSERLVVIQPKRHSLTQDTRRTDAVAFCIASKSSNVAVYVIEIVRRSICQMGCTSRVYAIEI